MDQDNGQMQGSAPVTPTHIPGEQYVPLDHQVTDHGTPDPAPFAPRQSTFTPSNFQPVQPAAPSYNSTPMPAPVAAAMEPVSRSSTLSAPSDDRPVPVVKVLSVRGVEYAMMTIMLWFGAASLIWILDTLVLGGANFDVMAFPLSILLIALPVFAFLYLRLRKAELADPSLRLEPSKRRFSQITQIVAFLTCVFNLIALVYVLISVAGGGSAGAIGKTVGATAITLVVAGGILVYYWFDEHRLIKR